MWALWQKLGAWNALLFEAFVEEALLPLVPKGSVFVLDNARIHHSQTPQPEPAREGRGRWLLPALPAALLPGLQPHRVGLELDQTSRPL